jgi:acyl-CoA thioesterase I
VAGGVAVAAWRRRRGRWLSTGGLVLAIVSGVPIHPAAYLVLTLSTAAWQLGSTRSATTRRAVDAVLILSVAAVLFAALAARGDSRLDLPRDKPVYVVGDSISAGLGTSKNGTWPQLLATRLGLNVSNLAQPGARLADGASQARSIPMGPAVVLVELGGNDVLDGATPAKFGVDLRSLLEVVKTRDRHVLMFELPLLPFQNSFGRVQREACKDYGVTLVPRSVLAGALTLPGHATDGLHLSPQGHAWLAARVSEMWL